MAGFGPVAPAGAFAAPAPLVVIARIAAAATTVATFVHPVM
jgi:hypothetical protein